MLECTALLGGIMNVAQQLVCWPRFPAKGSWLQNIDETLNREIPLSLFHHAYRLTFCHTLI